MTIRRRHTREYLLQVQSSDNCTWVSEQFFSIKHKDVLSRYCEWMFTHIIVEYDEVEGKKEEIVPVEIGTDEEGDDLSYEDSSNVMQTSDNNEENGGSPFNEIHENCDSEATSGPHTLQKTGIDRNLTVVIERLRYQQKVNSDKNSKPDSSQACHKNEGNVVSSKLPYQCEKCLKSLKRKHPLVNRKVDGEEEEIVPVEIGDGVTDDVSHEDVTNLLQKSNNNEGPAFDEIHENSDNEVDSGPHTSQNTEMDRNLRHGRLQCQQKVNCDKDSGLDKPLARYESEENIPNCQVPFQCLKCLRNFECRSALAGHEKTHNGKSLKCTVCSQEFPCMSSLNVHHQSVHSGNPARKHKCTKCATSFHKEVYLLRHYLGMHASIPCMLCNENFRTIGEYRIHRISHPGEEISCLICEKTFSTRGTLKTHMITHSDERKHNCSICGVSYKYKRKDVLKKHLRTRSRRSNDFVCTTCGALFYKSFYREKN